ncbi:MAG: flagellar biosynthesis protein FlhF [Clostridiaceae bacterium]
MIIKKYLVKDMNEAMTKIRYELGNEAIIISQRKVRKKGFKGIFSKKIYEVTAAIENQKKDEKESVEKSINAIKHAIKREKEREKKKETENIINNVQENDLVKEVKEMKNILNDLTFKSNNNVIKSDIEKILEENDFDKNTTTKILEGIKNQEGSDDVSKAKTIIRDMLLSNDEELLGNIVLVGPTGVGKTTTIAKLAAKLSLIEGKKVGLITIDNYRIGAVEQLKTYSEIINIPFKVIMNVDDLKLALKEMKELDTVLIDTTGRSSKNEEQIEELNNYIKIIETKKIFLVISATTKNKDIESIVEGYRILNYKDVIITKLDETTTYGSIVNLQNICKTPIIFLSTGQNVPDDIIKLDADEISQIALGEVKIW